MRPLALWAVIVAWLACAVAGCGAATTAPLVSEGPPSAPRHSGGPAPEIVVQSGHTNDIQKVVFSPNGQLLATGAGDSTIKLWYLRVHRELRTLYGHTMPVHSLSFRPDGAELASASADRTVRLWDVATGRETARLTGHGMAVLAVAYSPDAATIASAGLDGSIALWDAKAHTLTATIDAKDAVESLAWAPDGRAIAVTDSARVLRVFSVPEGRELRRLALGKDGEKETHIHIAADVAYARDGSKLVAGDALGVLHVLDAKDLHELEAIPAQNGFVQTAAFGADGVTIVSSGNGGIRLWNTATKAYKALDGFYPALSPDGTMVAGAGPNAAGTGDDGGQNVILWSASTGKRLLVMASPLVVANGAFIANAERYYTLAFHPSAPLLATAGLDGLVRVWDLRTAGPPRILGTGAWVNALAWSPDGDRLAACNFAKQDATSIYRVDTGELLRALPSSCKSIAWSPDGAHVVLGDRDGVVSTWDAATGARLSSEKAHGWDDKPPFKTGGRNDVTGLAFDHGVLWSTGRIDAKVARYTPEGRVAASRPGSPSWIDAMAIRDGVMAVGWGYHKVAQFAVEREIQNYVVLFDPATDQIKHVLKGHEALVQTVAFAPRGDVLASGGGDGAVRLWDVATGASLATFQEQADVWTVAFSSDGRLLATIGSDGAARLYDVASRKLVATLTAIAKDGYVVAGADGHYTASRGGLRGVAFRVGQRVVPFEQFDLRLNRPDLVLSSLGYADASLVAAYRRSYEKRLAKMRFTEAMLGDDTALPEVSLSARPPPSTRDEKLALKVRARGPLAIDRVLVFDNDVPVYGSAGVDVRAKASRDLEVPIEIPLSAGRNKIQVSALDTQGGESLKETFEVVGEAAPRPATLFVVAIGISAYDDPKLDLTYAAKDAQDLARLFAAQKKRFADVQVLEILDHDARKEKIASARALLQRSKVDDEVVLFIAGHGVVDKKLDYYFVTSDFDRKDAARRGMPYEALEALLDGIPARKKLLLIDTCHSGEVDKEPLASGVSGASVVASDPRVKAAGARGFELDGAPPQQLASIGMLTELFADLRRGSGAMVIASAGGAEYALESPEWHNGVFTFSVIEGLEAGRADADKDGVVRVSELREYVTERVRTLTGNKQNPTARRENLENDFPVF